MKMYYVPDCFAYIVEVAGIAIILYYITKTLVKVWSILSLYVLAEVTTDFSSFGQWSVVTGATDGIGLSFAKQLAAQGQNIVLISRSCEKLERVSRKIEEAYGVDTRIIVADFSSTDIYDRISSGLEGLNLGTLVNPIIHRLFRRSYYTGEGGSN